MISGGSTVSAPIFGRPMNLFMRSPWEKFPLTVNIALFTGSSRQGLQTDSCVEYHRPWGTPWKNTCPTLSKETMLGCIPGLMGSKHANLYIEKRCRLVPRSLFITPRSQAPDVQESDICKQTSTLLWLALPLCLVLLCVHDK